MTKPFLFLFFTASQLPALAQNQPSSGPASRNSITIESTAGKIDINTSEPGVRRYTGNVKLKHQGMLLFCDRAIHQVATNRLSAYGHVLLVQHDSITIKSDSLQYDGLNRQAVLFGHVLLQDRRLVLTTTRLDYDLQTGVARYTGKGRFVAGNHILTSLEGQFSTRTKLVSAYRQVRLETPLTALRVDSIQYNPLDQQAAATYLAQAAIVNKSEVLRSRAGNAYRVDPDQFRPGQNALTDGKAMKPIVANVVPEADNAASVRLALGLTPGRATIATERESVGTYKREVRPAKRPVLSARASVEQPLGESDLERLLNRKRQVH